MKRLILPPHVLRIIDNLIRNGHHAYAVGGCVRDLLMGRRPFDYDIATSATPSEVEKLFKSTVATGIAHGTVTVIEPEGKAEVTTFRTEGKYSDHRRPDKVYFITDVKEDLSRRDFTINAMAYNDDEGLTDPFGGENDIYAGLIRTVGDPYLRFSEDALRILRAFRFMAKLGFSIDDKTLKACSKLAESLKKISVERIAFELCEILKAAEPMHIEALYKANIMEAVLPEAMPFDKEKIFRAAASDRLPAKWAHMCGEKVSVALSRLKCPNALLRSAAELAMLAKADLSDFKTVAAGLKYNTFEDLCLFLGDDEALRKYRLAVEKGEAVKISDLAIGGEELSDFLSGREIGEALSKLIAHVRKNPQDNNPEALKSLLKVFGYLN